MISSHIGFIGIILGAIVGAGLTILGPTILSKAQSVPPKQLIQESLQKKPEQTVGDSALQEDQHIPEQSVTKEKNGQASQVPPSN